MQIPFPFVAFFLFLTKMSFILMWLFLDKKPRQHCKLFLEKEFIWKNEVKELRKQLYARRKLKRGMSNVVS